MAGFDASQFADVPVSPELMLLALELANEPLRGRRKEADAVTLAADAYAEYAGLEDDDEDIPIETNVIGALACRLVALADVVQANRIAPGTFEPEHVAAGACAARLIAVKGGRAFQIFDFLAQVDRAAKAPRAW